MSKKILVTGGTGFLGRNLINGLLKSGFTNILATYHNSDPPKLEYVEWIQVDLYGDHIPEKYLKNIDVAYIFAAVSSGSKDIVERPEIFLATNSTMNQKTILTLVEAKVKHIVFPSCSVMYKNSLMVQDENDVVLHEIYEKYVGGSVMKLYIEGLCKFYSGISETAFTVIRHTNTYGPYDKFDLDKGHVLSSLLLKLKNNPSEIEVWGTGEEGRDFVYVDDLVDLFISVAESSVNRKNFELICAGSEKLVSIRELLMEMCKIKKVDPRIKFNNEKPSLPINIVLSHQRAKKMYNWVPRTSLQVGLANTINWLENYSDLN
jgi:nucleoside-diphosphate-sugar epimerase